MLGFSRIKSPITFSEPNLNHSLSAGEVRTNGLIIPDLSFPPPRKPEELEHATAGPDAPHILAGRRELVMACVSGGGARAARLSAHVFALLEEEYNKSIKIHPAGQTPQGSPLAERISVWSTVSGGSVFASTVASHLRDEGARTNLFQHLRDGANPKWATKRLGGMAAVYYFWPANLAYAPIMQLLTEWDTRNLFARTLAVFQEGRLPLLPPSSLRKLGELPQQPVFLFNATCLENGRPFVFTRDILHKNLSDNGTLAMANDPLVAWAKGEEAPDANYAEPLRFATTLEDLGSSAPRFPLVHAVMASAAFPGVFQPLVLTYFRPNGSSSTTASGGKKDKPGWHRDGTVTVVDGGIYDNTGMATGLEYYGSVRRAASPEKGPKLVLLAIDAGNEPQNPRAVTPGNHGPFHLDLPVRGLLPAASTFAKVYNNQQSLVRAAIDQRIRQLAANGSSIRIDFNLLRATNLVEKLRKIPTDFVITDTEDRLLAEAARVIVNQGRPELGGKTPAEAFVEALNSPAETAKK